MKQFKTVTLIIFSATSLAERSQTLSFIIKSIHKGEKDIGIAKGKKIDFLFLMVTK